MPRVRVRQHVNPLSEKYQTPPTLPNWGKIYSDLSQPFFLDIGAARGRFLLEMAQVQPDYNYLGLEIREPLVIEANRIRDELALTNLHYLFCQVNISLNVILASLPKKAVEYVTIQFPDPWFKKRHGKRRIVQPELVNALAEYLPSQATVFLQSDVEFVSLEMSRHFAQHPAFIRENLSWLSENPLPVATEREISTINQNEPVYRTLFSKN
ncbi:tRNA (guanine-N(7)-)-methyltransferase [Halothece sp. PCC 7418]|uniref:tRNA (guanosine(46)-N7)-methyltransferase TrmB n=1 Tax=Halothece sp. (strain PCC 7418) TaxID=65093 RepID=UPI0002A07BD0|nr:tRNA (guanosine(46)-N7)-methyltransferase TrmB [Halothece sp. PCC 7418]AFZ45241.1 tRNA (guanine-N(7)-)-methyltransferase [Halothece sp. PCC 7418]